MAWNERKLVVAFEPFSADQRKRITECAEKYGCRVVFCKDRTEALPEISDAEILFGMDSSLVGETESIRWVCTPSAGVNHFLDVLSGKDILLSNSSGAYGLTIAEHIIMVSLEIMRKRPEYRKLAEKRIWEHDLPVRSLNGARITLAGTGDIGVEAAKRLRAFGPECMTGVNRRGANPEQLFDRIVPLDRIEEILPETDVLILSLPSTPQTRNLLTKDRLDLLPDTAYLINVGRGDVLDQSALEQKLREGSLGGAALDVFEKEPLDPESTLWDCPRLVLTTHVAGNWTLPHTVERIAELFIRDLENYLEGRPLVNSVDLSIGY